MYNVVMNTTKHKKGDVREDGMICWRMHKGKPYWVTKDHYSAMIAKERHQANKRTEAFIKHPRVHSKGDVNGEGLIFWSYSKTTVGFETWVSKDKYDQYNDRHKKSNKAYKKTDKAKTARKSRFKKNYNDTLYRIKHLTRNRIVIAFRRNGYKKNTKTADVLGCSFEDLKKHLESQFTEGMTWDNQADWHIDHRLPLASANTEEELIALAHHRNLQPMWEKDNLIKGDDYCPKELKRYLTKYL